MYTKRGFENFARTSHGKKFQDLFPSLIPDDESGSGEV
jgi:hypothetical protein